MVGNKIARAISAMLIIATLAAGTTVVGAVHTPTAPVPTPGQTVDVFLSDQTCNAVGCAVCEVLAIQDCARQNEQPDGGDHCHEFEDECHCHWECVPVVAGA